MIRNLRLSDVPRQLLPGRLGGDDLAYTRADVSAPTQHLSQVQLLSWSLGSSTRRHPVVSIERGRLNGVAVLRPRRSSRVWEFEHLVVSEQGAERLPSLLERCVAAAGAHGGERLFLRVPHESPVYYAACRAGFMPAYSEEVFMLDRPLWTGASDPYLGLRPLNEADRHGLFRLYHAAVPPTVRSLTGLTLEQWWDAREEPRGSAHEYVWERDGHIGGWLRFAKCGDELGLDALLHADERSAASALVADAAHLAPKHARTAWVVPGYQPTLALVLKGQGWEPRRMYGVLVRPVANRVREPALMPVQA